MTIYMVAEAKSVYEYPTQGGISVSNLRAPSNDTDLLDPLERLREQREQVPPAPDNILHHKNWTRVEQPVTKQRDSPPATG